MSQFLNTQKLNLYIPKIIKKSTKELIIVVPYIKISQRIYDAINFANNNGVEIIIIYRENKLDPREKEKLVNLNNISLLFHPNIHCKTVYNGNSLIVGSMNLYEYSEQHNREMGVLYEDLDLSDYEIEKDFVEDYSEELRQIVNSSTIEKLSVNFTTNGFNISLIESEEETIWKICQNLNHAFVNKRFKPFFIFDNRCDALCDNFYDNLDLRYYTKPRFEIDVNLPYNVKSKLYSLWYPIYHNYYRNDISIYWNRIDKPIYIYINIIDPENNDKAQVEYFKIVSAKIDYVISIYKKLYKQATNQRIYQ